MKTSQTLFLFFLFLAGCTMSYNAVQDNPSIPLDLERYIIREGRDGMISNRQPGKCYAKALIPDQYDKYVEEHIVYTGDLADETIDYQTVRIETKPVTTAWKKKKADRNCLSADPQDCLVWCLVDVPAEFVELPVLYDTLATDQFEVRTIEILELASKGGYTAWMEVVCNDDINPDFVKQLKNKLSFAGYDTGTESKYMDQATKEALTNFQKANRLPVGQLDRCTLDHLRIRY